MLDRAAKEASTRVKAVLARAASGGRPPLTRSGCATECAPGTTTGNTTGPNTGPNHCLNTELTCFAC